MYLDVSSVLHILLNWMALLVLWSFTFVFLYAEVRFACWAFANFIFYVIVFNASCPVIVH
jgi:hypothetical protein